MRSLVTALVASIALAGAAHAVAATNVHAFGVGVTVVASCTITVQAVAGPAGRLGRVCGELYKATVIKPEQPRILVTRDDVARVTHTTIEF